MDRKKLTKAEIIDQIHEKLNVSRNEIHDVIDEFFEELK